MLILDASHAAYRAHYAAPTPAEARRAVQTITRRYLDRFRPRRGSAIAALDPGGRTWRHDIFPLYKAHRPPRPAELTALLAELAALLTADGWRVIQVPGYEADDVIATLAHRYGTVIVSPDKDLYQLIGVGPRTPASGPVDPTSGSQVWCPRAEALVTASDVRVKFGVRLDLGEAPERIAEIQGLQGDPTDGIPGASRVGERGARDLIRVYGTCEAVIAAARAGPLDGSIARAASLRQRVLDSVPDIRLSRALARLRMDVPI